MSGGEKGEEIRREEQRGRREKEKERGRRERERGITEKERERAKEKNGISQSVYCESIRHFIKNLGVE